MLTLLNLGFCVVYMVEFVVLCRLLCWIWGSLSITIFLVYLKAQEVGEQMNSVVEFPGRKACRARKLY